MSGQSVVEFALVLPVMLLVLIFLITIPGFTAWDILVASNIADQAAQDGANAIAVHNDTAAACPVAKAEAEQQMRASALSLQKLTVTCQVIDEARYGLEGVQQVVVTIDFSIHLPLPGSISFSQSVKGWARIERAIGP
jgi:Flp pilus assembly protein TadG